MFFLNRRSAGQAEENEGSEGRGWVVVLIEMRRGLGGKVGGFRVVGGVV